MIDQFEVNNLSVGLDYLPKEVSKIVNKNICNGGGGGGTTTTELDPDIKNAILPAIKDVSNMYMSDDFDKIADQTASRAALQAQEKLAARTLEEGLGNEALLNQMKNTQAVPISALAHHHWSTAIIPQNSGLNAQRSSHGAIRGAVHQRLSCAPVRRGLSSQAQEVCDITKAAQVPVGAILCHQQQCDHWAEHSKRARK